MERRVARRTLIAGAATVAVAGCIGDGDDADGDRSGDGDEGDRLPDECPTTRELDVERPDELTADTVEAFVETYENRYYRDVVLEYEPGSRLDDYRLDASVQGDPEERGDGYVATVDGAGAVYRPSLDAVARIAEAPDGRDRVPYDAVDDRALRCPLDDAVDAAAQDDGDAATADGGAAKDGDDEAGADVVIGFDSDAEVDSFLDLLASLFENFDGLDGPNESATLYFDVDGTDVELAVSSTTFHGDYWWRVRYYVDERVVRRTDDEDADPRDGDLLECREAP